MSLDYQLAWPHDLPRQGIYSITCVVTGQVYVGQSRRIRGRWRDHVKELSAGRGCPRLQKAWDEHGGATFEFQVLEGGVDPSQMTAREQYHMDRLGVCGPEGLNTLPTAGSFKGYTPDAEARAKVGAATRRRFKADPTAQPKMVAASRACGYAPTAEHRRKISAAQKGISRGAMPEEQREAISKAKAGKAPLAAIAAKTGSKTSEETKRKIGAANSKALKGRPWSAARRASYERQRENQA